MADYAKMILAKDNRPATKVIIDTIISLKITQIPWCHVDNQVVIYIWYLTNTVTIFCFSRQIWATIFC